MKTEKLTTTEVARRLRVGVSAVKRWADDGTLECEKTPGGHRRFLASQVEQLRRRNLHPQPQDDTSLWLRSLESGDTYAAVARLFGERARLGSWFQTADYVGRLLFEVGERWVHGSVTVAQEHVVTSTLQRALTVIAESIHTPTFAPRCLLACAEGDDHTLGLSLADLCLREAGWRSDWFGRSTRRDDVRERIETSSVQMVALSASMHSADRELLASEAQAIAAACGSRGIPLILGGTGAWPETPEAGTRVRLFEEFAAILRAHSDRTANDNARTTP